MTCRSRSLFAAYAIPIFIRLAANGGVPEHAHPSPDVMILIIKRRAIAGSLIGGISEIKGLDFCAKHKIVADIEMIRIDQIEQAFDRMQRNDVRYRFVIDSATLDA
jgi:uncharacterized zinc-type alcohol dehydrogenase-like protein